MIKTNRGRLSHPKSKPKKSKKCPHQHLITYLQTHSLNYTLLLKSKSISEAPFIVTSSSMRQSLTQAYPACRHYLVQYKGKTHQSHTFISLLIALNHNITPVLLSIGVGTDAINKRQMLIQQISEIRNENGKFPQIIFTDDPDSLKGLEGELESIQNLEVVASYSYQYQKLKSILIDKNLKKFPYEVKKATLEIKAIIEAPNKFKMRESIQKFIEWNPQGYEEIIFSKTINKYLLSSLPKKNYGFYLTFCYESAINSLCRKFQRKFEVGLLSFFDEIFKLQEQEKKTRQFIDIFNIAEMNVDIWALQYRLYPKPYSHLLENFLQGRSLKWKKNDGFTFQVGGKASGAYQVKQIDGQWVCSCEYTEKIGIPCKHLIKVLCLKKKSLDDRIYEGFWIEKLEEQDDP